MRDAGGTFDRRLVNSVKSFSFNALMSCSTESSRATSRAIMVVADVKFGTVPLRDNSHAPKAGQSHPSFCEWLQVEIDFNCYKSQYRKKCCTCASRGTLMVISVGLFMSNPLAIPCSSAHQRLVRPSQARQWRRCSEVFLSS